MLNELSRAARVGLALVLMIGASVLTLGVMLIVRGITSDSDRPEPALTEVALLPLVLQTEVTETAQPPSATFTTVPPSATPETTASPYQIGVTFTYTPTTVPTLTPAGTALPLPDVSVVVVEDGCPHPANWQAYTVQAGDTLFAFQLGASNTVTVDQIMTANCLEDRFVYEGQVIWLPDGAAENAPSSYVAPTAIPDNPGAPPPPDGLTRNPACPCSVAIRQGWRVEQIAELIDSVPVGFRGTDFLTAVANASAYPRDFLVGVPAGASLEGFMLPGTYTVTNEMGARSFVEMVLDAFGAAFEAQVWSDAAARGFSPYQAVTLASIINMESGSYSEQLLISSVFHNRLNANNGLGATVTTQYALGRPGNWWPDVQGVVSTYDSPYNTNIYAGLPPSPIVSPSAEAVRAAVYPADTAYMYFTASCNGSGNAYAVTYDEHLANVRCE